MTEDPDPGWEASVERSRARRVEARRERDRRRKRGAALAGAAVLAFGVGVTVGAGDGGGGSDGPGARARAAGSGRVERPPPTLPGGGRTIFAPRPRGRAKTKAEAPDTRVVAFYGTSTTDALGTLGQGTPAQAARRVVRQARAYARPGRRVFPAFELIATVAANSAGDGGLYRNQLPLSDARRYLRAIRRVHGLLIIDVQPGRSDFLTEVQRFAPLLREPDVSLALDPEWSLGPGEIPGQVIGHTDAGKVNEVSAWLARLVARNRLPQKLFVIHQFTSDMVQNRPLLRNRPGLALTINVDGFGGREVKKAKYAQLAPRRRDVHPGFKLFYREDVDIFSPREALGLKPSPLLINYQ